LAVSRKLLKLLKLAGLAQRSVFVPHCRMDRITVAPDDLEITLTVWLSTAGSQNAASIRDLWTRKGELRDIARQDAARRALAKYLVERMGMGSWEVTKPVKDVLYRG
jgi:hypothetical protein